jgi:hypothetical protein
MALGGLPAKPFGVECDQTIAASDRIHRRSRYGAELPGRFAVKRRHTTRTIRVWRIVRKSRPAEIQSHRIVIATSSTNPSVSRAGRKYSDQRLSIPESMKAGNMISADITIPEDSMIGRTDSSRRTTAHQFCSAPCIIYLWCLRR